LWGVSREESCRGRNRLVRRLRGGGRKTSSSSCRSCRRLRRRTTRLLRGCWLVCFYGILDFEHGYIHVLPGVGYVTWVRRGEEKWMRELYLRARRLPVERRGEQDTAKHNLSVLFESNLPMLDEHSCPLLEVVPPKSSFL